MPLLSGLLGGPLGSRLDLVGDRAALVFAAAAFESADHANGHVVVAIDLATEPNTGFGHFANAKGFFFGGSDLFRFPFHKFHSARRAPGNATARVQLVRASFFDQRFDQTFASGDIKGTNVFDGELRHGDSIGSGGERHQSPG